MESVGHIMRDGITEGMQYFDGEIADFLDERAPGTPSAGSSGSTEIEIER